MCVSHMQFFLLFLKRTGVQYAPARTWTTHGNVKEFGNTGGIAPETASGLRGSLSATYVRDLRRPQPPNGLGIVTWAQRSSITCGMCIRRARTHQRRGLLELFVCAHCRKISSGFNEIHGEITCVRVSVIACVCTCCVGQEWALGTRPGKGAKTAILGAVRVVSSRANFRCSNSPRRVGRSKRLAQPMFPSRLSCCVR